MAKVKPPRNKAAKRNRGRSIPWEEIAHRYETGEETQTELSEIYSVDLRKLGHRASQEEWTRKRSEFRRRYIDAARERIYKDKEALLAELNLTELKVVRRRLKHTQEYFDWIEDIEDEGDKARSISSHDTERVVKMEESALERWRKVLGANAEQPPTVELSVKWIPEWLKGPDGEGSDAS